MKGKRYIEEFKKEAVKQALKEDIQLVMWLSGLALPRTACTAGYRNTANQTLGKLIKPISQRRMRVSRPT